MQDNYFWFYTLSTIPQTLAAMIALAATFVVFKLNFITVKIQKSRKDLARFILLLTSYLHKEIHDIEPLSDKKFVELYEKALKNIKPDFPNLGLEIGIYVRMQNEMQRIIREDWKSRFPARQGRIVGYLKMQKKIFRSLLTERNTSLRLLGCSLIFTTLTIALSLFALPHFDIFKDPHFVVAFVLVLSLISVSLTGYSVWKISTV